MSSKSDGIPPEKYCECPLNFGDGKFHFAGENFVIECGNFFSASRKKEPEMGCSYR
jgi:hypothetical protein